VPGQSPVKDHLRSVAGGRIGVGPRPSKPVFVTEERVISHTDELRGSCGLGLRGASLVSAPRSYSGERFAELAPSRIALLLAPWQSQLSAQLRPNSARSLARRPGAISVYAP
jgi:hypothetical protein